MSKLLYDQDEDKLYVIEDDGFGWFVLFLVLATPFFIIAVWLRQYALFASEHPLLLWGVFLGLSWLLGRRLYRKKDVQSDKIGIVAVMVSVLPIAIGQAFYAIPYILSHEGAVGVAFEWMIVTFFTVGISVFVIQISLLFRDGIKHLMVAAVYLVIALFIIL